MWVRLGASYRLSAIVVHGMFVLPCVFRAKLLSLQIE